MLDELGIATKAREFVKLCGPLALPVSVHAYAAQIGGTVAEHVEDDLHRLHVGVFHRRIDSVELPHCTVDVLTDSVVRRVRTCTARKG